MNSTDTTDKKAVRKLDESEEGSVNIRDEGSYNSHGRKFNPEENPSKGKIKVELLFFDSFSDSVFLHDLDGNFIHANKAAQKSTGHSKDELAGIKLHDLLPIYDDDVKSFLSSPLASNNDFMDKGFLVFKSVFLWQDKSIIPVEVHSRVIESGKGILSVVHDLGSQMQVASCLRESEEKYYQLFHQANDIIFLLELDEENMPVNVVEFNDISCQKLGYTREEIQNMDIASFYFPEELDFPGIEEELLKTGTSQFEMSLRVKDGSRIPAEVNLHRYKLNSRMVALAIARDITERREKEEAIKKSEKQYRGIVEGVQSGVISIDTRENVIYANQQMIDMVGCAGEEVVGVSLSKFVHPEELVKIRKHFKRRSEGKSEVYELKLIHKDGSEIWTLVSASPLFNSKSEFLGSVAIITDISARKGIEQALMDTVVEKDHYNKVILGNMLDAINELLERDQTEFLDEYFDYT